MKREDRSLLVYVAGPALALATTTGPVAARSGDAAARKKLPAAVATAVDANCAGFEIDKLDIEKEEGITLYDIEFRAGKGEIEVAADGTVLDVATIVQLKDVPEAAAAVIRRAAGTGGIKQIEKSEVRAEIQKDGAKGRVTLLAAPRYVYEAELARGGEIEVAADGTIIKGPKGMAKEPAQQK